MSEPSPEDQDRNNSIRRFGLRLCNYCSRFFSCLNVQFGPERLLRKNTIHFDHHPTSSSLYNAIKIGCQLCIRLEYEARKKGDIDAKGSLIDQLLEPKISWQIRVDKYRDSPIIPIDLYTDGGRGKHLVRLEGVPQSAFADPGTLGEPN